MAKNQIVEANRVEEWYEELIQDLRKLEYDGIVGPKHAIGKRILQDELKFGKPEYGSRKIEGLAKELDVSWQDIYACIKFARKFPELSDAVRELSWRRITHNLLPESREKPGYHTPVVVYDDVVGSLDDFVCSLPESVTPSHNSRVLAASERLIAQAGSQAVCCES